MIHLMVIIGFKIGSTIFIYRNLSVFQIFFCLKKNMEDFLNQERFLEIANNSGRTRSKNSLLSMSLNRMLDRC